MIALKIQGSTWKCERIRNAHLGFEINILNEPHIVELGFKSDYHIWLERETNGKIRDTAETSSNNSMLCKPWVYEEYLHSTNWTSRTAIEVLQRRDPTRPFFLQIGYHIPHPPIDPPLHFLELYKDKKLPTVPIGEWTSKFSNKTKDVYNAEWGELPSELVDLARRGYYASLTHIDQQIGEIFWYLKKHARLFDDTYVIFTSDHGELLGDHHIYKKSSALEGSANIPFIVKPVWVNYSIRP